MSSLGSSQAPNPHDLAGLQVHSGPYRGSLVWAAEGRQEAEKPERREAEGEEGK